MPEVAPEMQWASIEVMATGHEMDSLAQFFASLTVHDCSALSLAINGAAEFGRSAAQRAVNFPSIIYIAPPNIRDSREVDPSQFWNWETRTASFRSIFDPMSRRRHAIIANARQASFYGMYGMHPDEFQARCANCKLPFPIADEDAISLFIYALVSEQFKRKTSTVYTEIFLRGGMGCGTVKLISVRRWVMMDAFGRISEVLRARSCTRVCIGVKNICPHARA